MEYKRPALRGNLGYFVVLIVAERARFGFVCYNVPRAACVRRPGESAGIGNSKACTNNDYRPTIWLQWTTNNVYIQSECLGLCGCKLMYAAAKRVS